MNRLLRTGLRLALGLGSAATMPAFAQELNFRAVAPPRPAAVSNEIPITLTQPTPWGAPTVRAKVQDDNLVFTSTDGPRAGLQPIAFSQQQPAVFAQQAPARYNQMPTGSPSDFIAPAPSMITHPPGNNPVTGTPPPTVIDNPTMGGTMGSGPISGPMSGHISGPISGSGCNCSSGYSMLDGFVSNDSCCGNSCCVDSCDDCHPFDRIYDFFTCGCGGCCAPRPSFWLRGEYLLYGISRQQLPALVTQAPTRSQLALDSGASTILYGDNGVPNTFMNGGRLSAGFWFPRHCDWGLDGSYMFLGQRTDRFFASSNGNPALGRPFTDNTPLIVRDVLGGGVTALIANPGFNLPNAEVVSSAGVPGNIAVLSTSQLSSWDINLRRKLCCGPNYWIDGLVGYRNFNLEDSVSITEDIGPRTNNGSFAQRTVVNDSFFTRNTFNGGQVGVEGEYRFWRRLSLGGSLKVAVGNMHQNITINGSTSLTNATFPSGAVIGQATQSGGLLAQGTNIGSYSTDRLAVMPELGIKLAWDINNHWRVFAGYNVMYMSNVVRAAEQIDTRVNYSQAAFSGYTPQNAVAGTRVVQDGSHGVLLPGSPATPSVLFRTSEFWAQGVSFGLEYRY